MAPLTEREEAERDDLLDLSRYIASVPSALFATELTEKELVVAQALIVVGGTLYTGAADREKDRRQQMLRVIGIPE